MKMTRRLGIHDIPKQQIRWLVNRLHVSTSDEDVSKHITERMKDTQWTPGAIKAAGAYAIKVHHDNQNLCKRYHF